MMKRLENQMSVAIILIPIGFSLVTAGIVSNINVISHIGLISAGVISVIGGIIYVNQLSKKIGERETEQANLESQRFEQLLNEIRALRQ